MRVDQPVLSDDPILRHDLQLPDSWWVDLAGTLEKVLAGDTNCAACKSSTWTGPSPSSSASRHPPSPARTTAHSDVHWANLTKPLRLLDWGGWGQAQKGVDAATLYAYTLLQPDTAARVRAAFPILGSMAGLAAEATMCAQLLQTVARNDNLVLEDRLRDWSEELRQR